MTDAREIQREAGEPERAKLPLAINRNFRTARRRFLPKLLKVAGKIPFADDLAAAYYAAIDPATPRKAKGVLLAALAYFVVPTDAVPDVVAGLGFTDDATVLATALGIVGAHVKENHRRAARRLLGIKEPSIQPADEA
ncbi:MAG: YkvA family protein [Hyphomonadaceae bacterium]|nr:YkvA family protein [Hyphomonadaceae bacterium]